MRKEKKYKKQRKTTDINFRILENIRSQISHKLKDRNYHKESKTVDILGCSINDFKFYIESKFESWMSWKNYGLYNGEVNHGWDLDHIIPISSANTLEELLKLNHYSNFQPLDSFINRVIKRDKCKEE
jgi:hypothetical protein